MPDPVADQRLAALHEEEAHGRREDADDGARGQREAHELTLEHARARVVPDAGEVAGRAVEDDRPAHEDEALDEALDGAELVRDVQDRDAELRVQAIEEAGERLLRLGVDAGRRLVEHEERGLARRAPSR